MVVRKCSTILLLLCALLLSSCAHTKESEIHQGQIYLYGDTHADAKCLEQELELWGELYTNGTRDLFLEMPYYTAAYLNEWMHTKSDDILNQLYQDLSGTQNHSQDVLDFYRQIKMDYPETVFHGTDVGHQYDSTGARYLAEMRTAGHADSEAYALALENIEQGKTFYTLTQQNESEAYAYRENCMVQNFIREYENLSGANVMGIYGAMHTDPESLDFSGNVDSMAKQLTARYGDKLHTEDLIYADPTHTERPRGGSKE